MALNWLMTLPLIGAPLIFLRARSAQLEREQSAFVLVNIVLWDAFPFLAAMIFLGVEILFAALTDPGASSSARLAMKAGSAANADSAAIVRTTLHAHGGS